jgi:hypothetical protein
MSKEIAFRNAHRAAFPDVYAAHDRATVGQARAARTGAADAANRGSCLALWTRKAIRRQEWIEANKEVDAYHDRVSQQRWSGLGKVVPAQVETRFAGAVDLEDLHERCKAKRFISSVTQDVEPDPVMTAWVETIYLRMGIRNVCFFSGSYSDKYGYPHGLMLPRNVQADFKRALADYGFANRDWFDAVEAHKTGRDVLHCHALIADMSREDMRLLEACWTRDRGWSKAVRCHDGGVNYCCKYVLKSNNGDSFDWSWAT